MDKIHLLFLKSLKASLDDCPLQWEEEIEQEEWSKLFQLANKHKVLPLVYDGILRSEVFQKTGMVYATQLKRMSMQSMFLQIQKTQAFFEIYNALAKQGLKPIVVKGLICRNLYPNPDLRSSNDEDIYIPANDFEKYHEILETHGYELQKGEEAVESVYMNTAASLMIEVHRELMDMELSSIADMNALFDGAFDRSIEVEIDGHMIRTLSHTDHLLFLILHAFKHFVVGGFGIRQVLDMLIFTQQYGAEIDWNSVFYRCASFHADEFAYAIFEIGKKYFDYDYDQACFPQELRKEVDSIPLLEDLLDAGIYGASSMSRKHSAGVTLNTLQANYEGKKSSGILASLFPSAEKLEERYSYLKKSKLLLPLAWAQRIWNYRKETAGNRDGNNAAESIKIGNERVELMKKYGIIK